MRLHVSPTAMPDGQSYHCYVYNDDRTTNKQIMVRMEEAKQMYPDKYLDKAVKEYAKAKFMENQ